MNIKRPMLVAGMALMLAGSVRALIPGANGMSLRSPDRGAVIVREATLREAKDDWRLDARFDIELPPAVRAGLDSGVPLQFVMSLALREIRAWRLDPLLERVHRRYELVYYELTRHYRVRSLDDGTGRNYRSLLTALEGLGQLTDVPINAPSADRVPIKASLSLALDEQSLPLPLQSLWRSSWDLSSETLYFQVTIS